MSEAAQHTVDDLRDYDHFIINSPIDGELYPRVLGVVAKNRSKPNVVLTITTYGGLANVAFRIGRLFQSMYDRIVIFIPSQCKSAGTLLAACGHSLTFGPFGELGPLDVQLRQKDEISGRRSGLNTMSALDDLKNHAFALFEHFMLGIVGNSSGAISFKTAAEVSAKTTSEIMASIYSQINAETLGQDNRDLAVATKYFTMLNKKSENIKPGGIRKLVHGYPSHDFVIDVEEADDIFISIEPPATVLYKGLSVWADLVLFPREEGDRVVVYQPFAEEPTDAAGSRDEDEPSLEVHTSEPGSDRDRGTEGQQETNDSGTGEDLRAGLSEGDGETGPKVE